MQTFVDRVLGFYYSDEKIWVRTYQIGVTAIQCIGVSTPTVCDSIALKWGNLPFVRKTFTQRIIDGPTFDRVCVCHTFLQRVRSKQTIPWWNHKEELRRVRRHTHAFILSNHPGGRDAKVQIPSLQVLVPFFANPSLNRTCEQTCVLHDRGVNLLRRILLLWLLPNYRRFQSARYLSLDRLWCPKSQSAMANFR